VILSLLAERPMHGYQVNLELERRCVRDWAAISRPQIYYSLEKLAKAGLIRAGESEDRWNAKTGRHSATDRHS
jgi:DNA-binding PadR family transcriptional regulator